MRNIYYILLSIALLLLAVSSGWAAPVTQDNTAQADALMASPSLYFEQAQHALALYEGGSPATPALLTKLSRTCFILGEMAPSDQRQGYYEKGLAFADKLLTQEPKGAAGHYWEGKNMGGLAEIGGMVQALKLLPRIMDDLKQTQILDMSYDQAGPDRGLGRIYFKAPGWPISVGDKGKSLSHLKAAVQLGPDNSTNHLYLAETLLATGDKTQAREELKKVLQAKSNAVSPAALEKDRWEAKRQLEEMEKK